MTYTVTVKDNTGKPVAAAYVDFVTQGVTLQTLATDSNGQITLDDSQDSGLLANGVLMDVTYPGYNKFSTPTTSLTANYVVTLGKGIPTGLLLVGAGLVAWLLLK